MNKNTIIAIGASVILGIATIMMWSSYHNQAVAHENNIELLSKKSESHLSNYSMKILEMVQISDKYKDGLLEIVKASISGRYGDDGNKALTSFINENNVTLDNNLYLNVQNAIRVGREEFQIHQERQMEECRKYKNDLGRFFSGKFMAMQGFPRIDLKHYCEVVSDAKTKRTFDTKEQEALQLK